MREAPENGNESLHSARANGMNEYNLMRAGNQCCRRVALLQTIEGLFNKAACDVSW